MNLIQALIEFVIPNIFYLISFILFYNLIKHISNTLISRQSLPLGPKGLPLVGYLPFLGEEPHKDITKLGDKYGNVFKLQLGVHNIVVLNDWEAVKDALYKDAFLGKPTNTPFSVLVDATGIVDFEGELWRDHRSFSLQALRDLGYGKGLMEDRIIDEITYLTKLIDESDGQQLNIHQLLVPSMSNNIGHLVFGHRLDFNDPKRVLFDKMVDQAATLFSVIGLLAVSPPWFSKLLFMLGAVTNKKRFNTIISTFNDEIESHQKSLDVNNKRDYIDAYLVEMQSRQLKDPNTHFDTKTLSANSRAIFAAGSQTVKTTLEWLLILSAKYSDHQKHIQEEIDSAIGRDRSPVYADRQYMPFTQAFINEYWRWKTVLPLNLMRCAVEDSHILGHFIPKGTQILVNIYAVHHDPKVWDKPQEFNPNRFLTPDGKQVIKTEAFIPFSAGKRNCVGETLGRIESFLYFVSLLQRYTIRSANNETLKLDDRFGLTLQPKKSPILEFHKRV